MRLLWTLVTSALVAPLLPAGSILLSHLDADFQAVFDPCAVCWNPEGARDFIRTSVEYVRDGSSKPFLFVEGAFATPPAAEFDGHGRPVETRPFHAPGLVGIIRSGYRPGVDFVHATSGALSDSLAHLDRYSAIVVASDWGGLLTAAELKLLNANKGAIETFVEKGGGVFALSESNGGIGQFNILTGLADPSMFDPVTHVLLPDRGLLKNETPYGFLPFAVKTHPTYGLADTAHTITPYGKKLGITQAMVTGNTSNLYFEPHPLLRVISYDQYGRIANAAINWTSSSVITPEPATFFLVGAALVMAGYRRRL